jgi:hypothetical protein
VIQFVLVFLRIEHLIDWPWKKVLIPTWIMLALFIINALIIFLEWTNKITGNKATIKYDYSLDGIL